MIYYPHGIESQSYFLFRRQPWLISRTAFNGSSVRQSIFWVLLSTRFGFSCIPLWFHLQWTSPAVVKFITIHQDPEYWSKFKSTRPSFRGLEFVHCFSGLIWSFQNSGWPKWPPKSSFLLSSIVVKRLPPQSRCAASSSFSCLKSLSRLNLSCAKSFRKKKKKI